MLGYSFNIVAKYLYFSFVKVHDRNIAWGLLGFVLFVEKIAYVLCYYVVYLKIDFRDIKLFKCHGAALNLCGGCHRIFHVASRGSPLTLAFQQGGGVMSSMSSFIVPSSKKGPL